MSTQLDDLVAEKVMGWTPDIAEDGKRCWIPDSKKFPGWKIYSFKPSQNIYDAWRVLDKLRKADHQIEVSCQKNKYVISTLKPDDPETFIEVMSKDVEKAACLIALKLMGVDEEETRMAWVEE